MVNWQEILEAYSRGPEILSRTLEDLPEESLDLALDDKNWSIRAIIHHIVEGDDLFVPFIKQALGGLGGVYRMNWYFQLTQIEWGKRWGFDKRDIGPALALFKANREHTCGILSGVDTPWEFKLSITWPGRDPIEYSIPEIMEIQIHHLDEHLAEIQAILDNASK